MSETAEDGILARNGSLVLITYDVDRPPQYHSYISEERFSRDDGKSPKAS